MKSKLMILIGLAVSALMLSGCSGYDDTDVRNQIDDLNGRVTKLEELAAQMNTNISSLMTVVEALENGDRIVSVTPLEDGSGYTVVFSKSGTITIYNGKDGETPSVSIKLDDDGQYYWSLDGEYLLDDDGNKIPATSKTEIPQIRVNDGNFELSFDGVNWQNIGSAGGAGVLEDIVEEGNDVYFILNTGTIITIPKVQVQDFALNIDKTEYAVSGGAKISVQYTVSSADAGTVITGYASNGYSVVFNSNGTSAGTVEITAPDPFVDGQVTVFAVKGSGEVSGKVITFKEGILIVDSSLLEETDAEGGDLYVIITANQDYTVSIPSDAAKWITYSVESTETDGIKEDVVIFTVSKNYAAESRSAVISVYDEAGNLADKNKFTISQKAGTGEKEPGYYNNIEDWEYDNGTIKF